MDKIEVGDWVLIIGDRLGIPLEQGYVFQVVELESYNRLRLYPHWVITIGHVVKLTEAQRILYT